MTPLGHRRYATARFLALAADYRRAKLYRLARDMLAYAAMCSTHPHPCINLAPFILARAKAYERLYHRSAAP